MSLAVSLAVRRIRDTVLIDVAVAVGYHTLILTARLAQAWHGLHGSPVGKQQADVQAAIHYFEGGSS